MTGGFQALRNLGEEKFLKVKNELARGKPAMTLAREIQSQWGDFKGVAEKTLTQQLNRLRNVMIEGDQGAELAKELVERNQEKNQFKLKLMRGTSIDVLQHMIAIESLQRERVQRLWDKERENNLYTSGLNVVVMDYVAILDKIQKLQFDLGVNEFKGPLPGFRGMMSSQTTNPDGSVRSDSMFMEAMASMHKVFEDREIRPPKQLEGG